ncbi:uncharacterized protein BX663DRAFT_545853 [Cokeromyces recurvatus]|uniref:uncharacterized protein n=1 Tax=Cokeromyces recurvatus TaxID=90255 RepID=UPI0022205480|nr:uncharacterized protein BX663DRAFT_545853 [Cokeromyces recurvatus]KAI7899304.1 hypothetical protein BX663DRAFT_545853 [Cokeromyces recurvatus]
MYILRVEEKQNTINFLPKRKHQHMDIKYLLCDNSSNFEKEYERQVTYWSSSSPSLLETLDSNLFISKKKKHQRRTPWTTSEDYLLEKGYLQGLSWAMISSRYLPHRSRGCCWGRFKTLRAKFLEQNPSYRTLRTRK